MGQGRGKLLAGLAAGTAVVVMLGALAAAAYADVQVCTPGAAPKCPSPVGLATDFETGLLYVAGHDDNRIDVFKNGGTEPGTPASFGGVTEPKWIAVDNVASSPSHHDVYSTAADFKVKKFEPNGTKVAEFGEHGDGTPEECQIEHPNDPVAVGPNGDVYLGDSYQTGAPGNFASRIVKFDAAGNCIGAVPLETSEGQNLTVESLAVDSTGVIYVLMHSFTIRQLIRQYSGTGALVKEFKDPGKELKDQPETRGLAVDEENHLFAEQVDVRATRAEHDHLFTEYDSAVGGGVLLKRFAYAQHEILGSPGLAALHTADGDLFASDPETGVRYLKLPPPGPVAFPEDCKVKSNAPGSVRATLQAEVNPEGQETHFFYEYEPLGGEGEPFSNAQSSSPVQLEKGEAPAVDFELHEAAQTVEPLKAETEYRCRVVATNADGTAQGPEGNFETREPFTFGPAWSSEVGETSASVNAEGNPNGSAWTGQIEYVTDAQYQASRFAEARLAPTPPLDYGSSEAMTLRTTTLTGLAPGTLYHYRLRATQPGFPEGLVCPHEDVRQGECPELEHTFRTYLPGEKSCDHRGYELVSPPEKNSAEVVGTIQAGRGVLDESNVLIQAGAASGEAVTYTSWTSFGDAQGAPSSSQYLSTRTPGGWRTTNVSPFGFQASLVTPPYLGFTPELGFGAVKAGETPLVAGCPAEVEDFYFYEAESGRYRCLTPEPPTEPPTKFGYFFNYAGASADGSRVFFKSRARYAGAKAGSGMNLYESHAGQVHVVNVLPGQSEPVAPTPRTAFGAKAREEIQTGQSVLHNAISADGSHAIWTYVPAPDAQYESSQLLDRINGTETVQVDAAHGGSQSGGGTFWAASSDGQVIYFTSPKRLVAGAKAGPGAEDLYRYDFSKPVESELRLIDLTRGNIAGGAQGVIGAAEDGSDVYFVATAALTPETEENAAGQKAEAGKDNLYVNDMGEGKTRFIGQLSGEDGLDWDAEPQHITARVSADGQHLAFLSAAAKLMPAGFDDALPNTNAAGKFAAAQKCRINGIGVLSGTAACPQAFLYDKQANALTCASCNPSGSRPVGPALLPSWSRMSEGPRYLSADGSRLFFETYDRLLPEDENGLRDVYEFERAGSGTCSASNPSFDPMSGGCHFLVSNGHSSDESFLIDASASGRDVFFSTRSALNGWDTNENFDVYDYREGGGFPEPVSPESCAGEAGCKPPATAPPPSPSPATPSFNGPGNPKPKKAKKHHKKKAKKHHRKGEGKGKQKHKGGKKGRAGR